MSKDTKKKANPILEDENELNEEETTTENETDEVEEEVVAPKAPAKGAKATTKAPVKAVVEETDEVEKPLIEREVPKRRTASSIEAEISADQKSVKEALAKQPKVRIFIPLGIGEKKGATSAFESVTINGYRMVLPKGEYCTVPQGVADIIEAHYNMSPENTEMGEAFRLDRPRSKDGMSTDEALS